MLPLFKEILIMEWLTNTYDPKKLEARRLVTRLLNETQEEAWQRLQAFLSDKIIGEPKASEQYTVEQLKSMNMVGVYRAT